MQVLAHASHHSIYILLIENSFLKQDHFFLKTCMELLTIAIFFRFVKYCEQAVYTFRNLVIFLSVYRCKYDVWQEVSDGVVMNVLIQ